MVGLRQSHQISIHALREEGDPRNRRLNHERAISIHALREEGDTTADNNTQQITEFLSTPSARRATERVFR